MRFSKVQAFLIFSAIAVAGPFAQVTAQNNPATEKPLANVEDHLSSATAMLDALEGESDPVVVRSKLEEVSTHIVAMQKAEPANPWLFYLVGRSHAVARRRGDAIDQLRRFVETREGRNEWKAFRILGDLFVDEFQRLAKSNYEKALQLKPDEPAVLYGLALCAMKLGDFEEALKYAKAAFVADKTNNPKYPALLARVHVNRREWTEAEAAALQAVKFADEAARKSPLDRILLETLVSQLNLLIEVLQRRSAESGWVPGDALRLSDFIGKRGDLGLREAILDKLRILESTAAKSPTPVPQFTEHIEQLRKDIEAQAKKPIVE